MAGAQAPEVPAAIRCQNHPLARAADHLGPLEGNEIDSPPFVRFDIPAADHVEHCPPDVDDPTKPEGGLDGCAPDPPAAQALQGMPTESKGISRGGNGLGRGQCKYRRLLSGWGLGVTPYRRRRC